MKNNKFIITIILVALLTISVTLLINIIASSRSKLELIIYEDENGNPHNPHLMCCHTNKIYKIIKTNTENAELLDVLQDGKYILYKDDVLKILNEETNETISVNLEKNYENYYLYTSTSNQELIGIVYYREYKDFFETNHSGFYNLKINKVLYDNTYSVITLIDGNFLEASKYDETNSHILSINEEKEILSYDRLENILYVYSNGNKKVLVLYNKESKLNSLYTETGELIASNIELISYKENQIYTITNKTLTVYDFDGNITTNKSLQDYNIKYLIDEYGIYISKNKLSILNLNSFTSTPLLDLKDTYSFANIKQGTNAYSEEIDDNIYIYLEDSSKSKPEDILVKIDIEVSYNTKTEDIKVKEVEGLKYIQDYNGETIQ